MVTEKIRITLLTAGLTLASLVGCSSDTEQSPAAESVENIAVESQQEETLTSAEESSSDETSKEAVESSTQNSGTSTDKQDETVISSSGYSDGEMQEIYAYYDGGLYYYETLSVVSQLPEDTEFVGESIITTSMPENNLEISCMPEGTQIYYSAEKDKVYLTTDGEEYRMLNCIDKEEENR